MLSLALSAELREIICAFGRFFDSFYRNNSSSGFGNLWHSVYACNDGYCDLPEVTGRAIVKRITM